MPAPIRRTLRSALLILAALSFALPHLQTQAFSAEAKKVDPCSLLTKADIQEALGKPVKDGKPNTSANPAVGIPCEYVVGDYGVFSILVKPLGPGETPDKVLSGLKGMNMKTADAPGIGDKSFFAFPGYGMVQLNTFKGPNYVIMTLMVPGLSEDGHKGPAERLMKKVLAKL